MLRRPGVGRVVLRVLASLSIIAAFEACRVGPGKPVSSARPYADYIGAEYRVVADDLSAYGIYGDWPNKTLTYVVLIPGVGSSYTFKIANDVHKEAAIATLKGFYFQRVSMPLEPAYAGFIFAVLYIY